MSVQQELLEIERKCWKSGVGARWMRPISCAWPSASFPAQSAGAGHGLRGETNQCDAEWNMEPHEVGALRGEFADRGLEEDNHRQRQQSQSEFRSVRDTAEGDDGDEARRKGRGDQ